MTLPNIIKQTVCTQQKSLTECIRSLQGLQFLRLSSTAETKPQLETCPERKVLKVAIVGRPNAGKSTLINSILDLNVCGVSHKSHTTKTYFKAAFTRGDTQIVFLDTPGIITQREYVRFKLSEDFVKWKEKVTKEADIIGLIHELYDPKDVYRFHINAIQHVQDLPETKPLFLVLNKIDLVIDKEALSKSMAEALLPEDPNKPGPRKRPRIWQRFSKVFFTAASQNVGVKEVSDYLLEQAVPGKWVFEPDQLFDKPLNLLVIDLLRAQLMDILPSEVPYLCKYEVEYMQENYLGEIICVALVTCKCARHVSLIVKNKRTGLRQISKNLESDLYKILKKVFRIRIVVVLENKEKKRNEPKE